ncbi:Glycosyltransferase family 1 protein, partial [Rhizoctonia solani]
MLERCCLSCYEVDEGSPNEGVFVADAIISNPPTFAHIHCAEALGIPLLLSFTMPWCATAAFPHPLVNVKQSGSHEPNAVNYYSYTLVDMLTWQGLGHAINKFRTKKLGLPYLSTASAVTMIQRSAIPWTYCISPALIPKPQDWLTHIDVVGFYFLDLANNYVPPTDLFDFLASGEPPIYVGLVGHFRFGSIVLNDPQEMTRAILAGISQAGVRAIVSPGWGGLDEAMVKAAGPHVFALGNAPHDWLFQHVSAVCHHGGAGTTAIGLKCGKPTIIVPFFGDQPWWAAQLAQQGAGPEPLDSRNLTSEGFAAAIRAALSTDTIEAAQRISEMINKEARWGQKRSGIISQASTVTQHAVGQVNYVLGIFRRLTMRMKVAFSAQVLADRGEIDMNKLKLYRSREYKTHASATDPISGTALPLLRVVNGFVHGVVKIGSSRPDKGVAKMVTSTVGGVQTVLQGVTEGLTNVPKLYGSEVRETKPVTGFASGIVEGGKGLAYGFYDGLTGLVNEPVRGFKEKGALGAAIGVGTGVLSFYMKPAAGFLQFFSMPMEGGVKDIRTLFTKGISQERVATRRAEGVLVVKQSSQEEQDAIIRAFAEHNDKTLRDRKGKGRLHHIGHRLCTAAPPAFVMRALRVFQAFLASPLCLTGLGASTFPSHTMILIDNKTDSTEIYPQAELLSQPDSYINGSEPAGSLVILDIPASSSHEYLPEAAMRPPPTYSPTTISPGGSTRMFVTNGRPDSVIDLVDPSASGISYPTEKARLPEYSETIVTEATIQSDGRIQVSFASSQGFLEGYAPPIYEPALEKDGGFNFPSMNINIMVVGSRGEVQPYVALGQQLQEYGHIVRISTHEMFRPLVKHAGLRFFSIGGDPSNLAEYMFLNAGPVSRSDNIKKGDIEKNQSMISEIMERCLLSCYEDDKVSGEEPGFAADLIISNPQTFAHIHCAEALGIPLHLSFRLEYLSPQSAVGIIEKASVPWTYCISPTVIPKPADWMANIDISGFCFPNMTKGYDPPRELVEFIESGEPPIYIGFGSIVLENPENMTKSVLGGVSQAGVRAIIATSPEGLDEGMIKAAGDGVFMLTTDTPHDWLFERVSAVVHHGGTGTTAIGLKWGKPTVTVPFFGDQPWWAAQITRLGVGPPPIHPNRLTAEVLANAIRVAISPESREAARKIGDVIRAEQGPKNAAESIHKHLPLLNMRCDLVPNRVAVWYSPTHKLRLSAFAAQVLAEAGELDINKLELHRSREYETHIGPIDPVSGTILPGIKILNDFGRGVAKLPSEPGKGATKMLSASTLGLQNTLQSAAEGMHNLPKVYGGEVRKHKKVTGIGSGFAQGGKEFALGLYDGFSDFFMEPVRGFKRGGVLGAIGGVGIGALNLTTKPTAGFMHAVSMPIEGTVKEVKSLLNRQVGKDRIVTRYAQGVSAARSASEAERESVVRAFIERVSQGDSASTVNKEDKKGKGKAKII